MCDTARRARIPDIVRRAVRAKARCVHTPSQFVADEVIESFAADPERVRAVHSGIPERAEVDQERAKQAVADLLPDGTSRVIVSLATAEPRKDLPGLVAAFDELAADRPDVTLVLAGPVGWGEQELSRAIGASPHADGSFEPAGSTTRPSPD
jgi:glycosyltransferase involved in cell wall biosynthesis